MHQHVTKNVHFYLSNKLRVFLQAGMHLDQVSLVHYNILDRKVHLIHLQKSNCRFHISINRQVSLYKFKYIFSKTNLCSRLLKILIHRKAIMHHWNLPKNNLHIVLQEHYLHVVFLFHNTQIFGPELMIQTPTSIRLN